MSQSRQSAIVTFKVYPQLQQRIKDAARSQGVSASAFVKSAIAAQLGQFQQ